MSLPPLPFQAGGEFPPRIVAFPPTWIVIDTGHESDKEASEMIIKYLQTKFPPVYARRIEVPRGEQPDPFELLVHGVIAVGGPAAQNAWLPSYNALMDPRWEEDDETFDFEDPIDHPLHIVQKAPTEEDIRCTGKNEHACLIGSCQGAFPWLSIFQVAGHHAEDTVTAAELFCKGELRGIWVDGKKVGIL